MCQREVALGVVEPAVQLLELGAEAVQPFEHGVELAIIEGSAVSHDAIVRTPRIFEPSR